MDCDYNLAIPNATLSFASLVQRSLRRHRAAGFLTLWIVGVALAAGAADWSTPEQQLSRKIFSITGRGPVALSFENRSSIGRRESEIIQNGMRGAIESAGVHIAGGEQSTTVTISLSENAENYVWVAQIRTSAAELSVVMVSTPRPAGDVAAHESVPLSLTKTLLWTQLDPILDVAVLEESGGPTRLAVLGSETLTFYRRTNGSWQKEQAIEIAHSKPWPRDLRARMSRGRDHLLDVYLPGVLCRTSAGTPIALNCREADDPWPLNAGISAMGSIVSGFFSAPRNYFSGALTPPLGSISSVSPFYAAAALPQDKSTLWIFVGIDGQVHIVASGQERVEKMHWGGDLASVKTGCGAGWQLLATNTSDGSTDSVRAYEIPDRDPVAVSAAIDFSGPITALWAEDRGDTAVAIAKNRGTGGYEAFRVAMSCSQ